MITLDEYLKYKKSKALTVLEARAFGVPETKKHNISKRYGLNTASAIVLNDLWIKAKHKNTIPSLKTVSAVELIFNTILK